MSIFILFQFAQFIIPYRDTRSPAMYCTLHKHLKQANCRPRAKNGSAEARDFTMASGAFVPNEFRRGLWKNRPTLSGNCRPHSCLFPGKMPLYFSRSPPCCLLMYSGGRLSHKRLRAYLTTPPRPRLLNC